MSSVKYVVFDVGGVLLDWRGGLTAVATELNISEDSLLDFLLVYLKDLELGNITDDVFWKAVVEEQYLRLIWSTCGLITSLK